ncbi:hypothetical protein E1287_37740 [Actinomadura sp. KC06]|uniref:hypothetical protein n=1 Tax=Actinomadura sp. KC06 TaxID=2530369 RepID=UPI0010480D89|nr:hypothetical protein [Actinomadura sp. KC06]TDD25006.1 hypothetical protein E1287_37740 [Actinomadura sp. KC06]
MTDTEITYRRTADDTKHGMTLDELRRFLAGSAVLELPDTARVKVTATWRGTIKRLEIHQ